MSVRFAFFRLSPIRKKYGQSREREKTKARVGHVISALSLARTDRESKGIFPLTARPEHQELI